MNRYEVMGLIQDAMDGYRVLVVVPRGRWAVFEVEIPKDSPVVHYSRSEGIYRFEGGGELRHAHPDTRYIVGMVFDKIYMDRDAVLETRPELYDAVVGNATKNKAEVIWG